MKRFRDQNGKLNISLNELHKLTEQEARAYFRPGEIYLNREDGEEYVLAPITEQLAQFDSFTGKTLFIPVANLGSFLPDVASEERELTLNKQDEVIEDETSVEIPKEQIEVEDDEELEM